MSAQAIFELRGRNPDVLTCIANLSNDEVFTPPEFANRILDTVAEAWAANNGGANLWADKMLRFLDPFTKSGVFLREITSRLTKGLEAEIPDLQERVDHILTKQVFGIGITHLTSLLARRSIYCSKHANREHSITKSFTSDEGNICFVALSRSKILYHVNPMTQSFDKKLKEVNQRLKQANTGVTLIQKGNSLYARGTFPPKPGSAKTEPHQQEIALKVKAHPAGLTEAEARAKKIGTEMVLKEFDWTNYSTRPLSTAETKTVADWVRELETDYFQRRLRTPASECTWRTDYYKYLSQLPPEEKLTTDLLNKTIRNTTPDSCTRSAMCARYKVLGKFAGLEVEFINSLRGTYSSMRPGKRDLPSDETLVEAILQLEDPWWRWVAWILAIYGVRPHEIFHLDTQALENGQSIFIKVLKNTKTGERTVRPLYPEWIEQFNLRDRPLSKISGRDNSALGKTVSDHFRKKGMPFRPYDLRHCWAVRAIRFELPPKVAAKSMGHSVRVHTETYQAWIPEEIETEVFEKSLQNPNRPQAPIVKQVEVEAKTQQNLGARSLQFGSDSKQETAKPQSSELQGCLSETRMRA